MDCRAGGAVVNIEIKSRLDGRVLYSGNHESVREAAETGGVSV
jgi:hypothetical protein